MKPKHTPGPWKLVGDRIKTDSVDIVAAYPFWAGEYPQEAESNARLIASAPEMLTLLMEFSKNEWNADYCDHFAEQAAALIAKATGGAK